MAGRESQNQGSSGILKRDTLKTTGRDQDSSKEALTRERKNSTQRANLASLNTPGEEQTFGRRLSQSSIRRSTLNLNDIEAINSLEKESSNLEAEKRASNFQPRKSNAGMRGNQDDFPERKIFFGNSSKQHPKGPEALDIKLKNLMKIDNSKYWEANTSIEKIIFLNGRKHHPETASLIASGDLGWVFAWSVHRQGGLLGQFTATANDNESVTAMVCSRDADVLVTADSEGYIRAWNIENYCIHSPGRKSRRRQRAGALPKINITEDVVLSDKRNRQINNIPPDQIFQFHAHISPITVLDYCDDHEILFSASTEGTVRAWAMCGKYIGTFGQKRPWNLNKILDTSRPPDNSNRLPPDIKRVASYETLRLFNQGINTWKLAKNIMNILTIKNRIKNLKSAFSGGAKKAQANGEEEKKAEEDEKREENANSENAEEQPKSDSNANLLSVDGAKGALGRRKSFIKTARSVMQVAALSKPEESIDEKYEACLKRLGQSKYMQTYEPRNLNTNVRYEKIKLKVDLRRVLNSLPIGPLSDIPVVALPQVLKEAHKQQQESLQKEELKRSNIRKESNALNLQAKKSIRSIFAETARVKKVIEVFKKKKEL